MNRIARSRSRVILALTLTAALFGAAASAHVAPDRAEARPKLSRCEIGANRPLLCGKIDVPAVRGRPEAGRQKIGFAIRRRGDLSRPSKGAIVFLEGGPGYAATNADSFKSLAAVVAPFLKRRELIAIDQRGTGLSKPLFCRGLQRGTTGDWKGLKQCAKQLGVRREGYTTAESAADVEAVRKAIGLPRRKMIIYGDSYGTYLGQSYAARFGRGMKGLILSSAYPGNDPFWRSLYPAAERGVKRSCARSPNCSGNALGRLHRMLRKAGTKSRLTANVLGYLMDDASSFAPGSYHHLNRVVSRYLHGNGRELRQLVAPGSSNLGPAGYFSAGMYAAVVCNDYPVAWNKQSSIPDRRRQLERATSKFRPSDLWAPLRKSVWVRSAASGISSCLPWPAPTSEMQPPIPPGRKMPGRLDTLVLAGEFDAITSVREARAVEKRFPRGRLYVVPNRGHASELYFPFTSSATPRIRHFIRNLDRRTEPIAAISVSGERTPVIHPPVRAVEPVEPVASTAEGRPRPEATGPEVEPSKPGPLGWTVPFLPLSPAPRISTSNGFSSCLLLAGGRDEGDPVWLAASRGDAPWARWSSRRAAAVRRSGPALAW